jgi:hypothetical protein
MTLGRWSEVARDVLARSGETQRSSVPASGGGAG